MRYRIVLYPGARDTEPCGDAGRVDERRTARVERQRRFTVERQPLAVTPQRPRTRGNRVARGKHARGIEHGIERPEALFADRDGGRIVERSARAAHLRPRSYREWRCHARGHGLACTAGAEGGADRGTGRALRAMRASRIDASSAGSSG